MAVTIDGTTGIDKVQDGSIVYADLNSNIPLGTKNRIINGDMRIDQRNGTSTINATGVTYNVDRWLGRGVGSAGVFTLAQDTTSPANFTNSLKATVTTADSSIASGSSYRVQQFIEGYNIADLAWGTANAQTVTLSFWVRSSLTGTFGGSVANGDFDRFNVFSYTISSADTWEYKTVTIAGDTSGTWATNQDLAIRLNFSLGAGSSILTSAGSWGSVAKEGVTGQTNVIATTGATWYITGVQLEIGDTATPFENRMYSTELAMCQRYYYKNGLATSASLGTGVVQSATQANINVQFPVPMRSAPTLNYNALGVADLSARAVTALSSQATCVTSGYVFFTVDTGLTAGRGAYLYCLSASGFIDGDSEL